MVCSPKTGTTGTLVLWNDATLKKGVSFHEKVSILAGAIAFALRQAENGKPGLETCRKMGIAEQTSYRSQKRCIGGGEAAEGTVGGEPESEATGCEPQSGQADAAGCAENTSGSWTGARPREPQTDFQLLVGTMSKQITRFGFRTNRFRLFLRFNGISRKSFYRITETSNLLM